MKKLPLSILLAFCSVLPGFASAESADSSQPIQIFSDKFDGDDVKQVAVYTGDVAVHQGTLEIRGAKLVLTIDPQGYRHAVMTPQKGKLVTFKQRKDEKTPGVEEWMHGKGDKLTYNEKTNELTLTNNAQVSRSENGVMKDESRGTVITYNMTTSTADVVGSKNRGSAGRVSTVIAPRDSNFDASKPIELQSSKGIKR